MRFNFVFWISCGLFPHNKELTLSHVNLVCAVLSCSVPSDSLQPHGLWPARLPYPWGFSREEYWSALPLLLPGIFLTQGLNPHVLHCGQILYHLSHQQRPRYWSGLLYPFSKGSSQPRNPLGFPVLQADSLPVELPGKLKFGIYVYKSIKSKHEVKNTIPFFFFHPILSLFHFLVYGLCEYVCFRSDLIWGKIQN